MHRYEVALRAGLALGEGPFWDAASGMLWFVDVEGGAVHRFDPRSGARAERTFGEAVGSAIPSTHGEMVLGLGHGLHAASWTAPDDPSGSRLLAVVEGAADPTVRMNDAKCDPLGRLWADTVATDFRPGVSTLYRFGPDGAVPVVRGCALANGMGWSPAGDRMYLVDSRAHRILAFDYDLKTAAVSGRRTWIELPESAGHPDGIAVDAAGGVWVALYLGWAVHRYDADGTQTDVIDLPVSKVTSLCFGGPDLTDLYVTSARFGLTADQLRAQPSAGDVFVVPGAGQGLPGVRFDPATAGEGHPLSEERAD